jgi:hypothetical protein
MVMDLRGAPARLTSRRYIFVIIKAVDGEHVKCPQATPVVMQFSGTVCLVTIILYRFLSLLLCLLGMMTMECGHK